MDYLFRIVYYLWGLVGWRRWIVACSVGLVVGLVSGCLQRAQPNVWRKTVYRSLLAGYLYVLLATTVIMRKSMETRPSMDFDVLGTIAERLVGGYSTGYEVLLNVVMFVPIGFLLPLATGWRISRTMLMATILTLAVETSQFLLARGWFELSDVVENAVGSLVGYALYTLLYQIWRVALKR